MLKAGRSLVIAESEVFARADGSEETLVAKVIVTLAVVAGGKP